MVGVCQSAIMFGQQASKQAWEANQAIAAIAVPQLTLICDFVCFWWSCQLEVGVTFFMQDFWGHMHGSAVFGTVSHTIEFSHFKPRLALSMTHKYMQQHNNWWGIWNTSLAPFEVYLALYALQQWIGFSKETSKAATCWINWVHWYALIGPLYVRLYLNVSWMCGTIMHQDMVLQRWSSVW